MLVEVGNPISRSLQVGYVTSVLPVRVTSNTYYNRKYSRTPLIRINWDGELSGYAENPDNWIFL